MGGRGWRVAGALVVVLLVAAGCVPPSAGGPFDGRVEIERGRMAVNFTAVRLGLSAPEGTTEVRIANGDDPTQGKWRRYVPSVRWELGAGDGVRVVSVQFRDYSGGLSKVVSDSIVVDTVPPEVSVTTLDEGASVDLGSGELVVFGGQVTDEGSGVDGVQITTPGEEFSADLDGSSWGHPIGAPESGTYPFIGVASDVAGNSASVTRTVTMIAPEPDETVVRAGVVSIPPDVAAGLVDDGTDGDRLVFTGDQRSLFDGAEVVVGDVVEGASELGVMRRVDDVSFDPASDETVLSTEYADLLDLYAQVDIDTLVPIPDGEQRLPSAVAPGATPCDTFAQGKSIGFSADLPTVGGTLPFPFPGPSNYSGSVALDGQLSMYLDFELDIDMGWRSIELKKFSAIAGFLACGTFTASVDASTEDILGPRFTIGAATASVESELTSSLPDPSLTLAGFSSKKDTDIQEPAKLGIPLPGFPFLTLGPDLGITTDIAGKLATDLSLTGSLSVGARAGVELVDGDFTPVFEVLKDTNVEEPTVSLAAELFAGIGPSFGIKINEIDLFARLARVTIGPRVTLEAKWQGDIIGASSTKLSTQAQVCEIARATIGLKLGLRFKVGPAKLEFTVIDRDFGDIDRELACNQPIIWDHTQPPDPSVGEVDVVVPPAGTYQTRVAEKTGAYVFYREFFVRDSAQTGFAVYRREIWYSPGGKAPPQLVDSDETDNTADGYIEGLAIAPDGSVLAYKRIEVPDPDKPNEQIERVIVRSTADNSVVHELRRPLDFTNGDDWAWRRFDISDGGAFLYAPGDGRVGRSAWWDTTTGESGFVDYPSIPGDTYQSRSLQVCADGSGVVIPVDGGLARVDPRVTPMLPPGPPGWRIPAAPRPGVVGLVVASDCESVAVSNDSGITVGRPDGSSTVIDFASLLPDGRRVRGGKLSDDGSELILHAVRDDDQTSEFWRLGTGPQADRQLVASIAPGSFRSFVGAWLATHDPFDRYEAAIAPNGAFTISSIIQNPLDPTQNLDSIIVGQ